MVHLQRAPFRCLAASSPDKEIAQSRMITVLAVSTAFKLLSQA
jgi:hypothetical protein